MEIDFFQIIGNGRINKEIIENVTDKLLIKYNEAFEVLKIGNRYGTEFNNEATVICYPIKNKNLLFTSVLNIDRVTFRDDYYIRKICYELEDNIRKKYKSNNIEVIVRVQMMNKKELDKKYSLKEYLKEGNQSKFLVSIYIKGFDKKEDSKKVLKSIKKEYSSITIRGNIMELEEDDYKDIYDVFKSIPSTISYTIDSKKNKNIYRVEEVC